MPVPVWPCATIGWALAYILEYFISVGQGPPYNGAASGCTPPGPVRGISNCTPIVSFHPLYTVCRKLRTSCRQNHETVFSESRIANAAHTAASPFDRRA